MAQSEKPSSVLERIRKLDQERAELIDTVKADMLKAATEAVEALNALGFPYTLVEGKQAGATPKPKGGTARKSSSGPCPICEFQTEPAHDGRAHRGQGKKKAAFTKAELDERGFERL